MHPKRTTIANKVKFEEYYYYMDQMQLKKEKRILY